MRGRLRASIAMPSPSSSPTPWAARSSPRRPAVRHGADRLPGVIDRRPAMIARVADAADVARVIALAREHDLELAVRSGGHSPAGHGVSEGGIVLDLSDLRALQIDAERRTPGPRPA